MAFRLRLGAGHAGSGGLHGGRHSFTDISALAPFVLVETNTLEVPYNVAFLRQTADPTHDIAALDGGVVSLHPRREFARTF